MSKGKRRERQAAGLYEEAGYETFRPQESKFGETDMFGLFDVLAVGGGVHPILAQIKANQVRHINDWCDSAVRRVMPSTVAIHYLVCHDSEGWRLADCKKDGYEWVVDERDRDCNMGEGIVEYLRGDRNVQ